MNEAEHLNQKNKKHDSVPTVEEAKNWLTVISRYWLIIVPVILIIIGFSIYSNSLTVPFTFDDETAIRFNPNIRLTELSWENLSMVVKILGGSRPFAKLTFALNYYFHEFFPYINGHYLIINK